MYGMNSEISHQVKLKSLGQQIESLEKEEEVLEMQKLHGLEVYEELSTKRSDSEKETSDLESYIEATSNENHFLYDLYEQFIKGLSSRR